MTTLRRRGAPDHYARRAKAEAFAARAVYKLQEIDQKYHLFRPGGRVLDLGCAPGSWLQYIGPRVLPGGLVVGIDRTPVSISLLAHVTFLQADIETLDPEAVRALTPYFDAVVSDLAPATCGVKDVDHQRSLTLARLAWTWARAFLAPGGHFLVKVFEGPDFAGFVAEIKAACQRTQIVKPAGSRRESREIYLLGLGRKEGVN